MTRPGPHPDALEPKGSELVLHVVLEKIMINGIFYFSCNL